jgi:O-antigen/teichoic acid export membrane protein
MNIFYDNKLNLYRNFRQKGFFHLLSANILIQLVAFASQLFVAGILAPEDMGRIKIIQTYLAVFSTLAGMGFNISVLKLCSENRTDEDKMRLFQSAIIFTVVSTISLYIILLVLNFLHIFSSDKLIYWLIPLGLFPIISNSLFMVFVSYFQAIKKIKLISNLTISNKLLSIGAIVLLSYWFGIKGYYVAYNLSFLIMLIVCFRAIGLNFSGNIHNRDLKSQFSIHWFYAKKSMFANLLSDLSAYVDIILLNFFIKDMQQIGYYSFAVTITVILRLFPGTVQQIASPYFSSMATKKEEFITAFKKYNRLLYIIVFGSLIIIVIIMPYLTHWVFNGKYDQSMIYFPMLATGWSLRLLTQLQSGAIFGLGKIQYNAYVSLISLIFNIIVISISLYYFGLIGAAYASVLNGLVFILLSRFYYKKAQLEM